MRPLLLVLLPTVAAIPFDAEAHFPYGPFGVTPLESHFIDPSTAVVSQVSAKNSNDEKVQLASSKSESEDHFPYTPLGKKPLEHHFLKPRSTKSKVQLASNKSDSEDHFPYTPLGTKPLEHHFLKPRTTKRKVQLASTGSITDVPGTDEFQEAQEAVFDAVEKAEKSLFRFARKAEKAAEHAIEDEVDVLFTSNKKKFQDAATVEAKLAMADPDYILHAVEKMYD